MPSKHFKFTLHYELEEACIVQSSGILTLPLEQMISSQPIGTAICSNSILKYKLCSGNRSAISSAPSLIISKLLMLARNMRGSSRSARSNLHQNKKAIYHGHNCLSFIEVCEYQIPLHQGLDSRTSHCVQYVSRCKTFSKLEESFISNSAIVNIDPVDPDCGGYKYPYASYAIHHLLVMLKDQVL